MNEIDINIEGYNVNGICVGCLNYNRKMFYENKVKDCFKILSDIDVPDGLSIQVCWECIGAVRNAMRFRTQIQNSYEILSCYSKQHTFLNSPTDLSIHATTRLTTCKVLAETIQNDPGHPESDKEDIEVKSEKREDNVLVEDSTVELESLKKEENDLDDLGEVFRDDFQEQPESSDDDVQLSQLKVEKVDKEVRKKGKRGRKKKGEDVKLKEKNEAKRSKKKNKSLSEDSFEVYTMTEEEMWVMRAEDLASKEFANKKYKCETCLLTFNTQRLMNEHFSVKHELKGEVCYQCDICKSYFLSREHVSAHRARHRAAYRCRACGVCTGMRRRARRHAAAHRQACADCGEPFATRSKLLYHRTKVHKEKLQCDCCGKVFASKMTLKYHLKTASQVKEGQPKEQLFLPCRGCSKVFHSKKSYQAHVVIHNGVKYPCPTCGKLFQWKRNLARHQRNHRERLAGGAHECRPCGKTFSSRECLANHMKLSKRHVPEDAYVHACSYCGKKFATKWCLTDHVDWDHLKRFKYQCSVCFKPFKTAKIMVTHMRNIHEGKKKEAEGEHLCEICGKSYKTVKRLKGHVWAMHTNRSTSKSFKCALCPATFTWQTSIYKHMKMMHALNKRIKAERKKQEPYPEVELANRMQYFQQNLVQNIAHTTQQVPVGVVQNIV